ncbi:MAG: hypothetical protein HY922_13315 [Elusimicrobia bacterium]|nr:hypothetical protein [Elusimicrobiota bacterium]
MNPENESPQLPPFKSAQQPQKEEKKAGGGLPSAAGKGMPSFLRSAPKGSSPMLRVRGLGGGASLMERLKSLRKKDLAFIAAGLSVLIMAPLAEHFLMNPEDQAGQLQKGFSTNAAFPGDVGSIYDPGAGGFSPGGLLGQGSDVITPLNVRDPSALVMGPGAAQKLSATIEAPAAKPGDSSAWKDALAAAQKGATKATQKAALPVPHPKLAAGLRGLGAIGGGGGGSFTLPALSASNVPNTAAGSRSLQRVQAGPSFRGAASRSLAGGGGPESMKAGAAKQGDIMNKGGSASGALDQAAREAIPGGKPWGSGGATGAGDETKTPGYAKGGGEKNIGESLAYLKAKMEMEKALDLKWKKKAWYEFERQKMIEETVIKSAIENILGKGLFEPMGKAMAGLFDSLTSGGANILACQSPGGKLFTFDKGKIDGKTWLLDKDGKLYNGTVLWGTCSSAGENPPPGGGDSDHSPGNVDNAGNTSESNQTGHANIGTGLVKVKGNLDKAQGDLNSIQNLSAAYATQCGGATGPKSADVSEAYCAAVRVLEPKRAAYVKAVKSMANAGDQLTKARGHLANGVAAAQNELKGKAGGLDTVNSKIGTTETKFVEARDGLKQNEAKPSAEFKLDSKAVKAYDAGKAALEETKAPVAEVEQMIVHQNKGITLATNALEKNQKSSANYLKTAEKEVSDGGTGQAPAVPKDDRNEWLASNFTKVLGEVETNVKEQYTALTKLQTMAVGVRDELADARKAIHAYDKYANTQTEKKIITGEGAERKAADEEMIKGAAGASVKSIVEAAALTKGQFQVSGGASENPILGAALNLWKANVTTPCSTTCDLKTQVAAYNAALQQDQTIEPLKTANTNAGEAYKPAKEAADKVGTSAKAQ